jgi:hypothetical protein
MKFLEKASKRLPSPNRVREHEKTHQKTPNTCNARGFRVLDYFATANKRDISMSDSSIIECKYCGSEDLIKKENLCGLHWGAITCNSCGKHQQWLPNPLVSEKHQKREKLINEALTKKSVVGWESLFLRSIQSRRYLTPKQEEKFQQICDRHNLKMPVS